ncbi:cytochrome P450 [Actinoallomurus purpureus]|uniref:cytochrome P450 n=1 Tax=Actinoallomurus purpureus TaxID=478114 RepID=UPI0020920AD3|nr:cytochrome P450 [Actinoallomurus purpureus]MCO6007085.1 cytochrome P450 [Actinoallomurus purpureus]
MPVELAPGVPATLIIGYAAALEVLRDPNTFPKDPRRWQQRIPRDCPVLPLMMYRPNCMYTDGMIHSRLRQAVTDGLGSVDPNVLREHVEHSAEALIREFRSAGKADLLSLFARPLPLMVLSRTLGCPPVLSEQLAAGFKGIFDGVDAKRANAVLTHGVAELIALKRRDPQRDLTSRILAHPAGLSDEEALHQVLLLMGAGAEPEQNLIANTLRLMLTSDRVAGDVWGGNLLIEDALDELLWTDPPIANFAFTYPDRDVDFRGVRLPADQPVVISFAAANTDPSTASGNRVGNRAHLAWGAGPHACPAKRPAQLIATVAIEKLLDMLPGIELDASVTELDWRPGPFHRALTTLPVRFPPVSGGLSASRP